MWGLHRWYLQKLSSTHSESVCDSSFHHINEKSTWQNRDMLINLHVLTKAYAAKPIQRMQRMPHRRCYSMHSEGFLYSCFFFLKEMAFPSCSIMHPGSIFLFQYSALSVYNLRAVSQLLIYFLKITFILSHDFITFFIPFSLLGSSTLWKWWTLFY